MQEEAINIPIAPNDPNFPSLQQELLSQAEDSSLVPFC